MQLQCKAKTKSGKRCSRNVQEDSEYCYQHQPKEEKDYKEMSLEELKELMTEKQKRFADYFLETGEPKQSAIRAGYSENSAAQTANENLMKPYIKEYKDRLIESKDKSRIASQDEVLEYLTRVMRGEETEEEIISNQYGDREFLKVKPKIRDKNSAAKLLGQRYGTFIEKQELSVEALPKVELVRGKDGEE